MTNQVQPSSSVDFYRYPLDLTRNQLDTANLQHYSQELDRKSATLFVHASNDCKVALWQARRPKEYQGNVLAAKFQNLRAVVTIH